MKLKISLIGLLGFVLLLSSCLKNTDRLGFQSDKGSIVSEIATFNEQDPRVVSVEPLPAVETVDVIKLAFHNAKNQPSGDIKIQLELDPSIMVAYNHDNGLGATDSLLPLPLTSFTLSDPTLEITIPKGTYGEHMLKMTLTKAPLSLTRTYALGFRIKSVSEGVISDIANNILVMVGVKNRYDGVYELTLRLDGWDAFGIASQITEVYPVEVSLVTAGPNTVTTVAPNIGTNQPGWTGGVGSITGYTSFGATTPRYTFDLATDAVSSVANTTPDDGRGRTLFLNTTPLLPNKFNPANHNLYLEYYMTQTGRPNQRIYSSYKFLRAR